MRRKTISAARKRFGHNFRKRREEIGLSQQAIKDLCGVAASFISGIELGQRNVSIDTASLLANAVNRELHELLQP